MDVIMICDESIDARCFCSQAGKQGERKEWQAKERKEEEDDEELGIISIIYNVRGS